MTAQQQLNAVLFLVPLGLVFFGEVVLLVVRPGWLAVLAYVPVGSPRRVLLTPAARAALATGATYRDAAAGELSLAPLASPLEVDRCEVGFDADGRRATFRLPFGRMFAISGACAVTLAVDRDAVTLRAKLVPTLAPTGFAFFLPIIGLALADASKAEAPRMVALVMVTILVGMQLVGALRTRADFRHRVDAVMTAIEQRIGALG